MNGLRNLFAFLLTHLSVVDCLHSDTHENDTASDIMASAWLLTFIAGVYEQGALVEGPKVLEALPCQCRVCGSTQSGDRPIFG